MRHLLSALLLTLTALSARAEEARWTYMGHGQLIVNDLIGDRLDRWRTGSIAASHVFGPGWSGALPERPGEIVEFRILGEIIAPRKLNLAFAGDRPYAQSLSLGLHTHFQNGGWQASAGADVVVTGPQLGLDDLQMALHRAAHFNHRISPAVAAGQIPNDVHLAAVVEVGREFDLGRAVLRPFVESRAGVEGLARVGFDLTLGAVGRDALLVRDPVTGLRYRTTRGTARGVSFTAGADVARVWNSIYLPAPTYAPTDYRSRARAGLHWQGERWSGFYGLTWLGPEFRGQREGQVVGAMRLSWRF